jgi:hypothetical protein
MKRQVQRRHLVAGHRWLTPVILATQEAEIRRITVRSQPWQAVRKTLYRKKKRGGGWWSGSRDIGPVFKPQYRKKKKSHFVTDVTNSIRVLPSHAGLGYSDTWRSVEPKPSGSASTWQCLHQVRHHLDSSLALRGRWPGGGRGGQRGDTERCILPALPPLHTPHTLLRR